ncbi:MAG: 16S rRNA (guanine(527)-N(7))-methyltransferase RsmG [Bacilli bacterium]|nr:16S rRNA (guanine(527)-N(7))-methyltransferase RsmG [Bacilli bacterium]
MNKDLFLEELNKINIKLTTKQIEQLDKYCDLLLEYNKHTNLTAIKEKELVYLKHFYDSLTINKYIKKNDNVLDIGTGAGFPGMVLAIVRPDITINLLDSNNKKIKFLEYLKNELNITNVTLIHDRAEKFAHENLEKFDVVTSRAVARLRVLLELSIPVLKVNGIFIGMKANLDEELEESIITIELLNSEILKREMFKLPIENSNRENILIIKNNHCNHEYPREYDKIIKKPLVKKC